MHGNLFLKLPQRRQSGYCLTFFYFFKLYIIYSAVDTWYISDEAKREGKKEGWEGKV